MRMRWLWSFPLAVAATIVWLSSQSQYPGGIQLPPPLDKVAHISVFAALGWALDLALQQNRPGLPLYRRHLLVFVAVSCFGATDEWHQYFTPGRACELGDWLADTLGGALALLVRTLPALFTRRLRLLSWRRGNRRRPDPSRDLILVADPHWSRELTGLAEATAAHPEADGPPGHGLRGPGHLPRLGRRPACLWPLGGFLVRQPGVFPGWPCGLLRPHGRGHGGCPGW